MGLIMEQINKKDIVVPDWSFKDIDSEQYRKLEKSIHKHGQQKNIVVRSLGEGKYEVIDGKVVFEILKNLKKDFIWCTVYKNISKLEAQLVYLQLDYNFKKDYIELAKIIKKLSKKLSNLEISKLVNLEVKEVKELIVLNEFDFERYKPIEAAKQNNFF